MEFRDLGKQYANMKTQIDQGIQEVLNSAHFIQGNQVKDLEKKLADYVGVKHLSLSPPLILLEHGDLSCSLSCPGF